MTETTNESSANSFIDLPLRELPFHVLIGMDVTEMDDNQLRALAATITEERVSPAVRAAKKRKESAKLEGKVSKAASKKLAVSVEDLI